MYRSSFLGGGFVLVIIFHYAYLVKSIDKKLLQEKTQSKEIFLNEADEIIQISPAYFRPTEVDLLIGDSSKAAAQLGWKAATTFAELVEIMVQADLDFIKNPNLDY